MKWLTFNSLRQRYALLTIILSVIMLAFSLYAQNKVNVEKHNIENNIKERNKLFQHNQELRNSIQHSRDLLLKFQVDPNKVEDPKLISQSISQAIVHIERLSTHSWMQENYYATVTELIETLNQFDDISRKLIKVRLSPQKLFPSIKIANLRMRPLFSTVTQNIQLAIKEIEDDDISINYNEYLLLVELRNYWASMTSNFRMYLLNQLNVFQTSSRKNQLYLIKSFHQLIIKNLEALKKLQEKDKLSFSTTIALEKTYPATIEWLKEFYAVKKINESSAWRKDILIYQQELEPKLERINFLLRDLDLGLEKFIDNDLLALAEFSRLQANSIWITTLVSLLVLLLGFVSLVKLILNPIAEVTLALKDESKGIETYLSPNLPILETKNLTTAFKEMRKQIRTRQEELEHHALHDSLTGLANRDLLNDRLEQAIHNSKQDRSTFAILIMDLDRFKEVNDTLGHSVGDKLLQQVAERLIHLLRDVDVVVRLGGDEFSVLLTSAHREHAEIIAKKIINEFQNVFIIDEVPLYIGISIGISIYPEHGVTSQKLQQRADVAMYVAKRNKTGYEVYDPVHDEYSVGKLSLISDLRIAIDQNQLFMEYQPIIDLDSGKVISTEALLRWKHPTRGTIYPDDIIPIAEQTGLINPITYWIIDSTAKYSKKLNSMGIDIKVAINLSVYNLQEPDFIKNITNIFDSNEVSAPNFIMEVTESVMMTNPQQSIDVLNHLDLLGVEIAVDDYGTGYSSLSYLKRLPISKLKIDKSFIMDMLENDNDAMIVRSTIDLSHNLGMEVIAEGIEEKEALDLLSMLGCHFGQGYYISRPISENAFGKWAINNV